MQVPSNLDIVFVQLDRALVRTSTITPHIRQGCEDGVVVERRDAESAFDWTSLFAGKKLQIRISALGLLSGV